MKEMVKRMREEKGGFTIAELLIVVAIIAVLVAIAIPIFTSSLESANHGTATANARSFYSECAMKYMDTQNQTTPTTQDPAKFSDNMLAAYSYTLPANCTIMVNEAGTEITVAGPGASNTTTITTNPKVFGK